jgi:predicted nucleic acid-binding protein
MKFVISNATPLRYLIEIQAEYLLPHLFERVIIPNTVRDELIHQHTPKIVVDFIMNLPQWLEVYAMQKVDHSLQFLDPGEQAAISLATDLHPNAILLDERKARQVAQQRGLFCIGTVGILAEGVKQGLIQGAETVKKLQQTTFRVKPSLLEQIKNIPYP